MRILLLLMLLFTSVLSHAQWKVQVLDTADVDITAMGVADDLVIWASRPTSSLHPLGTAPLRLQVRRHVWSYDTLAPAQLNVQFDGQFRANSLVGLGNMAIPRLLVAGGYRDTCYLPNDTLIGYEPQSLDPFLMRVNAANGQPEWVWSRPQAGNNFIHKIHYPSGGWSQVLVSGQSNDTTGWLAAFDVQTGQLLWEKSWPGARTLSDASFGANLNSGEVFFTGTMTDSGYLHLLPVPLSTLPLTGFRSFAARYWPSTDSVAFMASTPCDTFSFEPSLMNSFYRIVWSTPSLENGPQRKRMSFHANPIFPPNIEYLEVTHWHAELDHPSSLGWTQLPLFFYQDPAAAPDRHLLKYGGIPPDTLQLTTGSTPGRAAALSDHMTTYHTIKSTGDIQFRRSWLGDPWVNYTVMGASPQSPRWVVMYDNTVGGSVRESHQLSFSIYPNPNNIGLVRIQWEKEIDLPSSWRLHDLQGKLLESGSLAAGENNLPLPQLAPGIYLLEVEQAARKGWQRLVVH